MPAKGIPLLGLVFVAWGLAYGQPPEMVRALESQRAGFEAYRKCVAEHRKEVDLHYAADNVIQYRDQRVKLDALFAANSDLQAKFPGGIEQVVADAFTRYRSLGGVGS